MTLYEGNTLQEWIGVRKVLDYHASIKVFQQIISGLKYIHNEGLCHRDLKPANIFMTQDGVIKIGDFGLAKDTLENQVNITPDDRSDECVGSPLYISPETLAGKACSKASDIYSVGVILCELFTLFDTQMERHKALMDLRRGIIPQELWNTPTVADAVLMLTKLDPLERPDCCLIEQAIIPHMVCCAPVDKLLPQVYPINGLKRSESHVIEIDQHLKRMETVRISYERYLKDLESLVASHTIEGSHEPLNFNTITLEDIALLKNLSMKEKATITCLRNRLSNDLRLQ